MTELIDTTEMYLRTVFELEEEGVPVLRARIVERLGHSGPTVSQTVARMERDGLLRVRPDRSVELSAEGRLRATRVMRKHRLAERLLSDVIGLEYAYVHDEACRWEHVISERVERRIIALLDDVGQSPYGNPIPGLDELGVDVSQPAGDRAALASVPVPDVPEGTGRVRVVSIGEPMQVHREVLGALREAGVLPGATVTVGREGNGYVVRAAGHDGEGVVLTPDRAASLFVVAAD